LVVVVVLFVGWCSVMNRLDEREERRQAEEMRRARPPVLGAPRHMRSGNRWQ
jgi:hypothetical protein